MSESEKVRIISRRLVRPSTAGGEPCRREIHLNQWDLHKLSIEYIQKGVLLPAPIPDLDLTAIPLLLSSFSQALDHGFRPFAGRLRTVHHPSSPPSLSVHLDANDAGAEFIHASLGHLTAADFASSHFVPPAVRSLFPLNGVNGHDGHFHPLLSAQVNVLADGSLFVACSLNHAVADGASFWHFFNTWSALARSDAAPRLALPVVDRWFAPGADPPPIPLPFRDASEFIHGSVFPQTQECFFHFPSSAVARLKAKANQEMAVTHISSLQALLAHLWLAATRARGLESHVETVYMVIVGHRKRVTPPLPDTYMGNAALGVEAFARAGELEDRGLGWAAWQLNRAVDSQSEESTLKWLKDWAKKPVMTRLTEQSMSAALGTGSSPRFDVFGNDFGWGSPVAVRSGGANKFDGKVTVYPGKDGGGSVALEVCLSAKALNVLIEDKAFMEAVGSLGE